MNVRRKNTIVISTPTALTTMVDSRVTANRDTLGMEQNAKVYLYTLLKFCLDILFKFCLKFRLDIDECAGSHDCHEKATCNDTVGSYICDCIFGYTGDGKSCKGMFGFIIYVSRYIYLDYDECGIGRINKCDTNAACSNYDGDYSCTCNKGYFGDGKVSCKGIFLNKSYCFV